MNVPIIQFKKILHTTDLSPAGRLAFAHATSIARQHNAALTVYHVVNIEDEPERQLSGYIDEKLWAQIRDRDLSEAHRILKTTQSNHATLIETVGAYCDNITANDDDPFVSYDIVVDTGNPVLKIIEKAENEQYDLIVMSLIAHSRLTEMVIGSTVKRVLRRTRVPVLVVPVAREKKTMTKGSV